MKILVTGARGFVGRNLVSQLHNIRDGKARNYGIAGEELTIYEYDMDSDPAELDVYCKQADFVFNLAGVNRPKDASEFMKGNFGFASTLLDTLKKYGNTCPVMISSSTQAALDNPYGESKRAGATEPWLHLRRPLLQRQTRLDCIGLLSELTFWFLRHRICMGAG